MRSRHSTSRLLGTVSTLALSVGAVIATAAIQPAAAAGAPNTGLWGGGSTLSSLSVRQVFDCYKGAEVSGDNYSTSSAFSSSQPTPGLLPTTCGSAVSGSVEGLFGGVGSGRGQQAFIAHDALQLVNGGPNFISGSAYPATVSTPATVPPFIDVGQAGNSNFDIYPYPGLSFAASDNPLPNAGAASNLTTAAFTFSTYPTTDWASNTNVTNITVAGTTTVSYSLTNFGQPVQLPLFEVPVAIAVNTTGLSGLQSAHVSPASPSDAGGAIQLSTAQVCAIFSSTVTDWGVTGNAGDSTTTIASLDQNGHLSAQLFYADNVSTTAASTAQPYAGAVSPTKVISSAPIHVTYRADSSGTSFIFTNYLKANCVALDSGSGYTTTVNGTIFTVPANHYAAIFGASGLPGTSFSTLASAVTAAGNSVANWQSATNSGGVAAAIGTGSTSPSTPGAIGYLSADFTTPYANTTIIAGAPNSASVQNENQRETGVLHPANGTSFVTPKPVAADAAYTALVNNATIPAAATYNDWNLYNYTYTTADKSGNAIPSVLQGKSVLGVPNTASAYPVAGTTFLDVYSCYANAATQVTGFLTWYYNSGNASTPNSTVESVLENNGFHGLNLSLANGLYTQYLSPSSSSRIAAPGTAGCSARASGA